MEENPSSSTTLIDISRYCSSFADGDLWSSSQSTHSRSPVQRLFSPTDTHHSSDSDSPILTSLPLPPANWSLTSSFAQMQLDSPLLSSLWPPSQPAPQPQQAQHQPCNCCRCVNPKELWSDKLQLNRNRPRPRVPKEEKCLSMPTPIQRPSPARRTTNLSSSLAHYENNPEDEKKNDRCSSHYHSSKIEDDQDDDDDDDDGTLRLHVSNIPFTWTKEKLAEVFGHFGTTFDVEVVYNERGSKGFGFVTFLAKKDALEAKRRMDREIVDGRRLVVNFAKPKQKSSNSSKESHSSTSRTNSAHWKSSSLSERTQRSHGNAYQSLGFSTPPTARRQHLSGFSSLSSTPTRSSSSTAQQNYPKYYL